MKEGDAGEQLATDARLFYHSCGATRDLIPDLIDLGFDTALEYGRYR